jgi:hypothetical protein
MKSVTLEESKYVLESRRVNTEWSIWLNENTVKNINKRINLKYEN